MKIENIEKNQSMEILLKYEVEGYITYELSGQSGCFSGKSTICVSREKIQEFKKRIREIKVGNEIFIYDTDSDCYIKLSY